MVEEIGINYVICFLVFSIAIIVYQIDRFFKHSLKHIDMLQHRVDEPEKRSGIKSSDTE
jgi:hypothetical protein